MARRHHKPIPAPDPSEWGDLSEEMGTHFVVGADEPPIQALDAEAIAELVDDAEKRLESSE